MADEKPQRQTELNVVQALHEFQKQNTMERGMQSTVDMAKLLFTFKKALVIEGFTHKEAIELTKDYFNAVMASQLIKPKE